MSRSHDEGLRALEVERAAPIQNDIVTILLSGRGKPIPPPMQTRTELEKIASDKCHSPLARRMAQASIDCYLYIGGAEMVAERIRRYKAGEDLG
jgi:hypothetical protein